MKMSVMIICCRIEIPFLQNRGLQITRYNLMSGFGFLKLISSFSCSSTGSKFSRDISLELA